MINLFFSGFIQVGLVSANVYFISHKLWIPLLVTGFLISYIWSHNVKKVVFGSERDRIIYSSGACLGGLTGVIISNLMGR